MRLHRFYTGKELKLKKDFWLHDEGLLWQWNKVLRFKVEQKVILFDGVQTERLYKITDLKKTEAHLEMITELERKLPDRHVYLFWSLLKKDNNDFILQKGTELGVSNFVPMLSERSIRDNFNIDRAKKIVLEAAEQSGRFSIPEVRTPLNLQTAIDEYEDKVEIIVASHGNRDSLKLEDNKRYAVLIGPEGGWSDNEKVLFEAKNLLHLQISEFTLRAETAAIIAASKLL